MKSTVTRHRALHSMRPVFGLALVLSASLLSSGCFVSARYGGILGEGTAGNEFAMTPGIHLGAQFIEQNGTGVRMSIGYHKMENTVGSSTTEGNELPIYGEYIGRLHLSGEPAEGQLGVHYTLGAGWTWLKLDPAKGGTDFYTLSGGILLTRRAGDGSHLGVEVRYERLFALDLGQSSALYAGLLWGL